MRFDETTIALLLYEHEKSVFSYLQIWTRKGLINKLDVRDFGVEEVNLLTSLEGEYDTSRFIFRQINGDRESVEKRKSGLRGNILLQFLFKGKMNYR